MKRIYVEAIVAWILFLWSLYNAGNNQDSKNPPFDPLGIGAFIQMWIAVAVAVEMWINSFLGG